MRRPSLLRALGVAVVAGCAVAVLSCAEGTEAPRHSIVLVTIDTTRPEYLSCYGHPRPTTPNLDALAESGVLVETAWAQAPETGPSLASTLTSRVAPVTGVRANAERLREGLPTLATVASDAGYDTAAFVSTALLGARWTALDRGFDVYDDEMTDPCFGHDRAQRIAERTIDAALAWLALPRDRPFLLWVHLYDPHGPYLPPRRDRPRMEDAPEPWAGVEVPEGAIPSYQRVGETHSAWDYVERYEAELSYADAELGRLFERLDRMATVVAVHADHGEAFGEDDYWFRHGSLLHDPALRIPWIVRSPGLPTRTRRTDGWARNLDLVPTLLAQAGLPPLPDAAGVDLSGWLAGSEVGEERPFVAEARRREEVRDATGIDTRWKLRFVSPGADWIWWPDAPHDGSGEGDEEAARAALAEWLATPVPEGDAGPQRVRDVRLDDALRGLGYR